MQKQNEQADEQQTTTEKKTAECKIRDAHGFSALAWQIFSSASYSDFRLPPTPRSAPLCSLRSRADPPTSVLSPSRDSPPPPPRSTPRLPRSVAAIVVARWVTVLQAKLGAVAEAASELAAIGLQRAMGSFFLRGWIHSWWGGSAERMRGGDPGGVRY